MKGIAAVLASMFAVLCIARAFAPASAARLPKIQTSASGTWSEAWRVRPSAIGFGKDFLIEHLRYTHYSKHSADARGRLLLDNCRPNCAQGGHWVSASADFYRVVHHHGPGRNFSHLKLTWHDHSRLLWINSHGDWTWTGR
jgi:hypothetical protein